MLGVPNEFVSQLSTDSSNKQVAEAAATPPARQQSTGLNVLERLQEAVGHSKPPLSGNKSTCLFPPIQRQTQTSSLLGKALTVLQPAASPVIFPFSNQVRSTEKIRFRDRRAFPRRPASANVQAATLLVQEPPVPAGEVEWKFRNNSHQGSVIDLSMNGVALNLAEPLPPEWNVLLRLSNKRLDYQTDVPARVLRVESLPSGRYKVVFTLLRRLTLHEVACFSDQLASCSVI